MGMDGECINAIANQGIRVLTVNMISMNANMVTVQPVQNVLMERTLSHVSVLMKGAHLQQMLMINKLLKMSNSNNSKKDKTKKEEKNFIFYLILRFGVVFHYSKWHLNQP